MKDLIVKEKKMKGGGGSFLEIGEVSRRNFLQQNPEGFSRAPFKSLTLFWFTEALKYWA